MIPTCWPLFWNCGIGCNYFRPFPFTSKDFVDATVTEGGDDLIRPINIILIAGQLRIVVMVDFMRLFDPSVIWSLVKLGFVVVAVEVVVM